MHIILGGTGRVGSALTEALIARAEPVIVVTHRPEAQAQLEAKGIAAAVVDIHDTDALRHVLNRGTRAFLLNPNADPATDTVAEERRTVESILNAVRGASLQKVVAQSTYGARPGNGQGDLNVLFELEQGLASLSISTAFVRGAYFMSNWDFALDSARSDGVVYTPYPTDFELPMVAPRDLGRSAARLITAPPTETGIYHVEGPARYTSGQVAAAFASALDRPVETVVIPEDEWEASFEAAGFSSEAAASYAAMTAATLDGGFPDPSDVERGKTSLQEYVAELVSRS